jgi:predicted ATPase
MRCARCRRINRDEARYCDACGSPLSSPPGSQPPAGRRAELERLTQVLAASIDGHGALVALAGEPGIGKSHTAQALALEAGGLGVRVLWGRCNEEPGAPPYWPWVQVLRAWLAAHDDATVQRTLAAAAAPLADVVPEIGERLPGLPALPPTIDPLQQRFRMFDAMSGFWKRAAAEEPLLLVLDNLHWADASSLRLLEFLVPEIEPLRVLLLATYRDIEVNRNHPLSATLGDLSRHAHFQRWRLVGLGRDETARMIAHLGGTGLTPRCWTCCMSRPRGIRCSSAR